MPALLVECRAPEGLALPPGEYGDGSRKIELLFRLPVPADQMDQIDPGLPVAMEVVVDDGLDEVQKESFKEKTARRLLDQLNLLIRWYRSELKGSAIHELTLAQVSPFHFFVIPSAELWGKYVATPLAVYTGSADPESYVPRVREGYASGDEPPVEVLLLTDARQAVHEGRFREAVLFCWSVVDGVFNQKFEFLVKSKLADEWKEGRTFLIGNDFGLRHKMSIGMRLVTGRSLARESDGFWQKLDQSYKNRNNIIHEGGIASEEDARLAIWVAERLVAVMKSFATEN